jgi:hypothetical protein
MARDSNPLSSQALTPNAPKPKDQLLAGVEEVEKAEAPAVCRGP